MAAHYRTMSFSIDTERLSLRLRTKDDASCNLELLREHEGGTTMTIEEAEHRMVQQNEQARVDGFGILGIRRRLEEVPMGYCGLIIGRSSFDEPEIAYELLPPFRGHGYATEAAGAVTQAAFATGRQRIWATVGRRNAPSFRVLEKLGFHADHSVDDARDQIVYMVRNSASR
jgi:RimJ/RimL family protein N-acetyltransferase